MLCIAERRCSGAVVAPRGAPRVAGWSKPNAQALARVDQPFQSGEALVSKQVILGAVLQLDPDDFHVLPTDSCKTFLQRRRKAR